ncbi:MAG TPA: biotin/lipoyl-containing protein [Anaerolineales bacterium]|nr:biotin/lipoyl-containing protein [Anaerolineales bacterium]
MKFSYDYNSEKILIDFIKAGKGYRAALEAQTVDVEVSRVEDGKLDLLIDGKRVTAYVSSENTKRWVTVNGQTFLLTKSSSARSRGHGAQHTKGELTAPMPGQVRAVNVSEGEAVTKGQTLLVLEAMKMEIRVHAPQDGVVKKLFVKQGETVEREQSLLYVESQTFDL